jgi:RNA polymerase sigma factor (sigma-70 family)
MKDEGPMETKQEKELENASRSFLENPEQAFAPFYELTKKKAYFLIYSYVRDYAEAEDLLQDAYVALLENTNRLACRHNPEAYLISTAKHLAIDALRKRKPTVDLDEEGTSEVVGLEDPGPNDTGALLEAIKKILNPFEFQVYTLHVLSDLTFREISPIVHRPIGTLTYTYSNAIEKLQKGLDPTWMRNSNPV